MIVFAGPAQPWQGMAVLGDGAREPAVFDALRAADTVQVNQAELQQLFAWYAHIEPDMDGPELAQACAELMENFSLRGLIVTLGARGALYFGADGARLAHDAVDASDPEAFAAAFLRGGLFG